MRRDDLLGDPRRMGHPHAFPLRKRCGRCGVQLRRWQLDLCRSCRMTVQWGSRGSRWDASPDGMEAPDAT